MSTGPSSDYPLTAIRCFEAAILLGLPFRAVPVTAEDQYALRGDALRAAIETDVAAGLIPFLASESYKQSPTMADLS